MQNEDVRRGVSAKLAVSIFALLFASCATQTSVRSVPAQSRPQYQPTGSEPSVAVLEFENVSLFESETLGPGVATMFQTALVRSRRFRVVERTQLQSVLDELSLPLAGIVAAGTDRLGQQLPVEYLIAGRVTEFGMKYTGDSFTGGVIDARVLAGGGARLTSSRGTARIAIDVKITDVRTGQIVYMTTATGEAYSESVGAGMLLLTATGVGAAAIVDSGVEGFDQTVAGKAARAAAELSLDQMVAEDVFRWMQH